VGEAIRRCPPGRVASAALRSSSVMFRTLVISESVILEQRSRKKNNLHNFNYCSSIKLESEGKKPIGFKRGKNINTVGMEG
jgi:hypothetical protein